MILNDTNALNMLCQIPGQRIRLSTIYLCHSFIRMLYLATWKIRSIRTRVKGLRLGKNRVTICRYCTHRFGQCMICKPKSCTLVWEAYPKDHCSSVIPIPAAVEKRRAPCGLPVRKSCTQRLTSRPALASPNLGGYPPVKSSSRAKKMSRICFCKEVSLGLQCNVQQGQKNNPRMDAANRPT